MIDIRYKNMEDFGCISRKNGNNSKIDDVESLMNATSLRLVEAGLIPKEREEVIMKMVTDFANVQESELMDDVEEKIEKDWMENIKMDGPQISMGSIGISIMITWVSVFYGLDTDVYRQMIFLMNICYLMIYYLFKMGFEYYYSTNVVVYKKPLMKAKAKFNLKMLEMRRKYSFQPAKRQMVYMYRKLRSEGKIPENSALEDQLIVKGMRSESGVMVVSVIMPPDRFSCSYDCHYCPNDPRYSRSYFHGEPTVMRGERNGFSGVKQFRERLIAYLLNGHPIDKCEVIILGGTFSCYQPKVAEEFITELYYAANTIFDEDSREMMSIREEIKMNEDAICKIIGMTIETRPDKITKYELKRLRRMGVTRIQMGLQHTDDEILEKVNRECTQSEIMSAIELLKNEGFKVDIHIMPDLPFSTIEKDKEMFKILLEDPRYRADQWKIYPTNVLEFTKIKEWYDNGEYKPYAESNFDGFLQLLIDVMKSLPPYIRVNRVQRDFPGNYIEGGNKITNLRQVLDEKMEELKDHTKDIRSMEIGGESFDVKRVRLVRYDYESSGGKEIFISMKSCTCEGQCMEYEMYKKKKWFMDKLGKKKWFYGCGKENKIYGFLRLRLSEKSGENSFSVLKKKGLIRELHVYGKVKTTYSTTDISKSQHHGFGGLLLKSAEEIANMEGDVDGMAVISGVGVRNYYRRHGYEIPEGDVNQHGDFMIKLF
jgi:ELP3 family radical SAM enzyme/protein acetyltransferase